MKVDTVINGFPAHTLSRIIPFKQFSNLIWRPSQFKFWYNTLPIFFCYFKLRTLIATLLQMIILCYYTYYRALGISGHHKTEKELRELASSQEEFLEQRKIKILPLLKELKQWLAKKSLTVRDSSRTGEAISYALGQWSKIMKYIDCTQLTPDNNGAENAIRPFVVGRKNWLFSGSPKGAEASCFYYSLIEIAKQNGLNPHLYLAYIFNQVPLITDKTEWKNFCLGTVKIMFNLIY